MYIWLKSGLPSEKILGHETVLLDSAWCRQEDVPASGIRRKETKKDSHWNSFANDRSLIG